MDKYDWWRCGIFSAGFGLLGIWYVLTMPEVKPGFIMGFVCLILGEMFNIEKMLIEEKEERP